METVELLKLITAKMENATKHLMRLKLEKQNGNELDIAELKGTIMAYVDLISILANEKAKELEDEEKI